MTQTAYARQLLLLVALLLVSPAKATESDEGDFGMWFNGTILTMDGPRPSTVEAVLVRDGRIVFAGAEARARQIAGDKAIVHDLKGSTMLPGFVDAHSHFAVAMQMAGGINLIDPARPVANIPDLLSRMREWVAENGQPKGGWVVGWQYDEGKLTEKRHVTRRELDSVLPDHKVVLVHFTGHGLVANSAALAAAGIDEQSATPDGGLMMRDSDGRLNGVLFETATTRMLRSIPPPTREENLAALEAVQRLYASNGFTHAQDGATNMANLSFLTSVPAKERLKLDLVLVPSAAVLNTLLEDRGLAFGIYRGRVKLQGIKFVLDGSPQARTAWFTRNYAQGSPEGTHPWHGTPTMTESEFLEKAKLVHSRGWQIFAHANGDAAIDMAIRTFDRMGLKAGRDARPVVIHSQFQRPDQLRAYRRIGIAPSYFSNHTYYFADIHRSNFPGKVVAFISPLKGALAAGLTPSNHSDAPVTPLDPMTQLWSSMSRTSLTGVVNGADQRLSAYQGLRALTVGPAWQVFDEDRKGTIKAGLLADFAILDRNPLVTPVSRIRSIRILETIKEGRVIWKRDEHPR